MIIGIPKEVKADEYRVSLTPDKVDLLVKSGHPVVVEAGAGVGANFSDDAYEEVGATILSEAVDVFDSVKLLLFILTKRDEISLNQHI